MNEDVFELMGLESGTEMFERLVIKPFIELAEKNNVNLKEYAKVVNNGNL